MVTVIAQFTAKTTNSEKSIYFLSLMLCSINKLNCHMLFSCKNLFFQILREKKASPGNGGGPGAPLRSPPFCTALLMKNLIFCTAFSKKTLKVNRLTLLQKVKMFQKNY